MNIINAKNSTGILAGITGLLFVLLYVGLEILTENPEATNSISAWHFLLPSGWQTMNDHISSRSNASSTRGACSNDHAGFTTLY